MENIDTLKVLLADLAEHLDRPEGEGGGAIPLAALTVIEELESQLRRPPRADPEPA